MYRLSCRYEPGVKRMGGRAKGGVKHKVKRGAWRVVECCWKDVLVVGPHVIDDELRIPCARAIRPGSFCDPFKELKGYLAARER